MLGMSLLTEVRNRFRSFLLQRKQLKALRNYSAVGQFEHGSYIPLIQKCLDESFLDEKEADFLCHMVDKYAINVMDWCYKTPWLKKQMKAMASESQVRQDDQLMMFEDPKGLGTAIMVSAESRRGTAMVDVPMELLTYQSPWESRRRA